MKKNETINESQVKSKKRVSDYGYSCAVSGLRSVKQKEIFGAIESIKSDFSLIPAQLHCVQYKYCRNIQL